MIILQFDLKHFYTACGHKSDTGQFSDTCQNSELELLQSFFFLIILIFLLDICKLSGHWCTQQTVAKAVK